MTRLNQIIINHYEPCGISFIFSSILNNKDINTRVAKYQLEKDIGVIFYVQQTKKFMKS